MILVYLGRWSYGRFKDDNNIFYKMKNDLTTRTWQDDIWFPIIIILLCTSGSIWVMDIAPPGLRFSWTTSPNRLKTSPKLPVSLNTTVRKKTSIAWSPFLYVRYLSQDHPHHTTNPTNTGTMVVEPPIPLAAWIWLIHIAWELVRLAHVCSKAAINAI